MLIELVVFISVIILALIFIAQMARMLALGLMAGAMFLILAAWIYGVPGNSGIQMNVGQQVLKNSTFDNSTGITLSNETITPIQANIPTTPYVDMQNILAFIFLLCGLSTIVYYSIEVMQPNEN